MPFTTKVSFVRCHKAKYNCPKDTITTTLPSFVGSFLRELSELCSSNNIQVPKLLTLRNHALKINYGLCMSCEYGNRMSLVFCRVSDCSIISDRRWSLYAWWMLMERCGFNTYGSFSSVSLKTTCTGQDVSNTIIVIIGYMRCMRDEC